MSLATLDSDIGWRLFLLMYSLCRTIWLNLESVRRARNLYNWTNRFRYTFLDLGADR